MISSREHHHHRRRREHEPFNPENSTRDRGGQAKAVNKLWTDTEKGHAFPGARATIIYLYSLLLLSGPLASGVRNAGEILEQSL